VVYDRWETVGTREGMPSGKVLAVLADGGGAWAGTEAGLARVEGGRVTRVLGTEDGLAHRVVTSLARHPRTGDLWIGTFGGLSRLSGGAITSFRAKTSGLMNDVVWSVSCEGDRVWVATASGLGRYDVNTGEWGCFDHTNAIFHEPWTYGVASDRGRVFVGVWAGGVCEHDPVAGTWKEYRDPDGESELDLLPDDGPIHDVTSSIACSEGVVWQATYFGLSRMAGGRWRSFLAKEGGLPSDFINAVGARGRWAFLATDRGLCVTDGDCFASYGRREDGRGRVRLVRPGREPQELVTETALPTEYLFASDAVGREVWVATAEGLAHGVGTAGTPVVPDARERGRLAPGRDR